MRVLNAADDADYLIPASHHRRRCQVDALDIIDRDNWARASASIKFKFIHWSGGGILAGGLLMNGVGREALGPIPIQGTGYSGVIVEALLLACPDCDAAL